MLMTQWNNLLDSSESRDEKLVHSFLERHPSLVPGSHTVDGDSGHAPVNRALISKPKLPGMSDREPDFMWIAKHSSEVFPVLIEIETPHKKWFYGDRAEIHSDLSHAQGQLAEWRAWFNRGNNRSSFLDYYEIPSGLRSMKLSPRFVLIHGRSKDYEGIPSRQEKRAELARTDERLMSFDRLTPAKNSAWLSCVRKERDGYRVIAVPSSFSISNDGSVYKNMSGWHEALDSCPDMAVERQLYLKSELSLLCEQPDAYVQTEGDIRFRRPRWL